MSQPIATGATNSDPNSVVTGTSERLAKPWHASDRVLPFLAEWESGSLNGVVRIFYSNHTHHDYHVTNGMILTVYNDDQGNPTVGCGHLVVPADHLHAGDTITLERGQQLLRADLVRTEKAINSKIHVPLYQYEYDALVSVIFNAGGGSAADDMADIVNAGNYSTIPESIRHFYVRNPRLLPRRSSEANMFASGGYDASH